MSIDIERQDLNLTRGIVQTRQSALFASATRLSEAERRASLSQIMLDDWTSSEGSLRPWESRKPFGTKPTALTQCLPSLLA